MKFLRGVRKNCAVVSTFVDGWDFRLQNTSPVTGTRRGQEVALFGRAMVPAGETSMLNKCAPFLLAGFCLFIAALDAPTVTRLIMGVSGLMWARAGISALRR